MDRQSTKLKVKQSHSLVTSSIEVTEVNFAGLVTIISQVIFPLYSRANNSANLCHLVLSPSSDSEHDPKRRTSTYRVLTV